MTKLRDKKSVETHRILIFGPPKVGKTELVGKLAEYFNLLWFDLENGYITLTKLPEDWQDNIELISLPDSRVYPIAIETMLKVIKGAEVHICEEHGKVTCALCKKDNKPSVRICLNELGPESIVVVDSLTQLTNSAISHITKAQADDYKLQLDDWGQLAVLIDKFLSQVQQAKYNVVCISHESEVKMEDGKVKLVAVSGSSNSSRNTAKYFDHVIYAQVLNKKHSFGSSTGFSMSAVTGSRTDIEIEKAAAPTLLDIFRNKPTKEQLIAARNRTAPVTSKAEIEISDAEKLKAQVASKQAHANLVKKASEVAATADTRTPGQIALDNLKLNTANKNGGNT